MEHLKNNQLFSINGGHDGTAYKIGRVVGDVIEVGISLFSIGKIYKWARRLT